jgi:capsular polysaccharide biosynthesis protein
VAVPVTYSRVAYLLMGVRAIKSMCRNVRFIYRPYVAIRVAAKNLIDLLTLSTRKILTREHLSRGELAKTVEFGSAEVVDFTKAKFHLHGTDDAFFRRLFRKTFEFAPPSCFQLSDAEIVGDRGVVLTSSGDIVLESTLNSTHYYRRSWNSPYVLRRHFLESETIDGPVISLVSPLSINYFHWMAECLPRLLSLEIFPTGSVEKVKILIDGERFPFQRQSILALFDLSESQIQTRKTFRTRVRNLYVPTYRHRNDQGTDSMDIYSFRVFREMCNRHRGRSSVPPSPQRHLFLQRPTGSSRQIVNADEFLQRFPFFEVFYAEHHSVQEQMDHFANAKVVVAAHGAGLANLTFMAPQAKVIELYPRGVNWTNALCSVPICCANDLIHHLLVVDTAPTTGDPLSGNIRLSDQNLFEIEAILEAEDS